MRILGLILILVGVGATLLMRPTKPLHRMVESRLGFAVVPPTIIAAFAMGIALAISG